MSDPLRLAEKGSDTSPLARELVRAGRTVAMDPSKKTEIWAAISAQCPPSVGPARGGATSTAAASSGAAAVVKGTVVLALLAGGTFAGYKSWKHHAPSYSVASHTQPVASLLLPEETAPTRPALGRQRQAAVVASSGASSAAEPAVTHPNATPVAVRTRAAQPSLRSNRSSRPVERAPERAPAATISEEERPVEAASSPERASRASSPERASRLSEESRLVVLARRDLRVGDTRTALRLLESAAGQFPDGALAQEREALTIEALARSGRPEVAARRAAAFLRDFPNSPHATNVKSFLAR